MLSLPARTWGTAVLRLVVGALMPAAALAQSRNGDMLVEQWLLTELNAALGKQVRTVILPSLGHGTLADACAKRIAAAFYGNPSVVVDTSCVAPRPRIVFER